jgi:hypothetical protein
MKKGLRITPPACLIISLAGLLTGRLCFSGYYLNKEVKGNDGKTFRIFRHIMIHPLQKESRSCVFVVQFRFAHLSHRANKIASIIPMLIISGFPGFMQKMYAVDHEGGFWQGIYQWRSQNDLEAYQRSFVFLMMNRRAVKSSVNSATFPDTNLNNYIEEKTNYSINDQK